MSNVAISVEGLGKKYRIGSGPAEPYGSLRDSLMRGIKAPLQRLRQVGQGSAVREHWALKDVSFEVKHGEAVGIIGRNGAGKSTLLKVLSRITEPTTGQAVVHGRVGSLLEVGTGFHPELTGRENIYLNGAVMGMSRADIKRHFDEIVDFSGVEKYLDTPVKRYSSGMYMRLAFAVAAHLEPEVLVVDEVLAVGDSEFQKKCLGKMGDVARSGRTVLFVSHNMGTIGQLCKSGVVLEHGQQTYLGPVADALQTYLSSSAEHQGNTRHFMPTTYKPLQILAIEVNDAAGNSRDSFDINDTITLHLNYRVNEPLKGANIAIILSRNGTDVLCTFDTDVNTQALEGRAPGLYTYLVEFPRRLLKAGTYSVTLSPGLINIQAFDILRDVITFEIQELTEDTLSRGYNENRPGQIIAPVMWRHREPLHPSRSTT